MIPRISYRCTVLAILSCLFLMILYMGTPGSLSASNNVYRQPQPSSVLRSLKTGREREEAEYSKTGSDSVVYETRPPPNDEGTQRTENLDEKIDRIFPGSRKDSDQLKSTAEQEEQLSVEKVANKDILKEEAKTDKKSYPKSPIKNSPRVKGLVPGSKALFPFSDLFPNKGRANINSSKAVQYGASLAVTRLKMEFFSEQSGGGDKPGGSYGRKLTNKAVTEMADNEVGMKIVGGITVGDNVPDTSARHVLIATTWRSGSSFLGDLLNHYPGSFYYYEPLHFTFSSSKDSKKLLPDQLLTTLYHCKFNDDNIAFLRHVSKSSNRFLFKNHNFRLWETCENLLPQSTMCFIPEYLSRVCPLYPIKLIKTVRLRVAATESMLKNPNLNLKVIVLVRDPRGVYNSRSEDQISAWCKSDQCASPEVGCVNLLDDIEAYLHLREKYGDRLMLVRYEDLSMDPETTVGRMLDFLDLPWTDSMHNYISTHTSTVKLQKVKNRQTKKMEMKQNPYDTVRNSTATAFKWRQSLPWDKVDEIQSFCSEPMERLGYKLLNEKDELSQSDISTFDVELPNL